MGLTYAFVRCDRIRMTEAQRSRSWNTATTGAAIFTFAPLCIVAHFWVTRRSLLGVLAGFAALIFLLVVQTGLTMLYQDVGVPWLIAVLVLQPVLITVLPIVVAAAVL
jgi:hypothetical protein